MDSRAIAAAYTLTAACLLPEAVVAQPAPASTTLAAAPSLTLTLHLPEPVTYRFDDQAGPGAPAIEAWPESGHPSVWFGPRIVLELEPGADWRPLLAGRPLPWLRSVTPAIHLFDAGDAWTALTESAQLGPIAGVRSCRPVMRQRIGLHRMMLAAPRNDPSFDALWHLENRRSDGSRRAPDLNARAAWSLTRGEGVVIAVVDDGVDLAHPEFEQAAAGPYHFNFTAGSTNGMPTGWDDYHGTLVAGFAVARDNNHRGIAGMAPRASLASWKIFNGTNIPDSFDDELMEMFQYLNDIVAVQNHSWGNAYAPPLRPSSLEQLGLSNAFTSGRDGRGVIMVRSAGNGRDSLHNANDDGYANDPRVITVGAVNSQGRTATYSNPGACLLVTAFGGGTDRALTSTDRLGTAGKSSGTGGIDSGDYWTSTELRGTSFSTPQISGIVALLLAVNPNLTIRDVQHILILAARQTDPLDPDIVSNHAGFSHSHNTGFGLPDAARAVTLARDWTPRPPMVERRRIATGTRAIPDDGLRIALASSAGGQTLLSAPATPSLGLLADTITDELPLVDVGFATNDLAINLAGKAALIRRGPAGTFADDRNTFRRKIERAAAAGAALAIVYNDRDQTARVTMGETDFAPIPAVMISQVDGESARDLLLINPTTSTVRLDVQRASATFEVSDTLACEHIGLRLDLAHTRRGDLQVILRSPSGTSSILQRASADTLSSPSNWTYWSTRHFGEPARGNWTAEIIDTAPGSTGTITRMELIMRGVEMVDIDNDGLDDRWEFNWFGHLHPKPHDNPNDHLWSNAQIQWIGSNPTQAPDLVVGLGQLNDGLGLLFWDASPGAVYQLSVGSSATEPFEELGTVTADRSQMEWILPLQPEFGLFRLLRR